MNHPSKEIMQRAIELARANYKEGGHAVAGIIVKSNELIAESFTTIIRDKDPTAHAEINAIRAACAKLDSFTLEDCYLYTTYEPCPMCTSAAIWAKMKGIVYGASRDDQTPESPWRVYVPAAEVIRNGTPKLELIEEFMREDCKKLLTLHG
jgi:tRNA(Arg) A34 adenosine deaminase TadA